MYAGNLRIITANCCRFYFVDTFYIVKNNTNNCYLDIIVAYCVSDGRSCAIKLHSTSSTPNRASV